MMKKILFPACFVFLTIAGIACSGGDTAEKAVETAEEEATVVDSLVTDAEETAKALEEKTEDVKKKVDQLLEDL